MADDDTSLGETDRRPVLRSLSPELVASTSDEDLEMDLITDAEIANGGLNQYFFNSTGALAPTAVEGYGAIGATGKAAIVAQAIARVLDAAPELRKAWSPRTLEAFMASYDLDVFGDLDDRFFELDDAEDTSRLRILYIRRNAEQFRVD